VGIAPLLCKNANVFRADPSHKQKNEIPQGKSKINKNMSRTRHQLSSSSILHPTSPLRPTLFHNPLSNPPPPLQNAHPLPKKQPNPHQPIPNSTHPSPERKTNNGLSKPPLRRIPPQHRPLPLPRRQLSPHNLLQPITIMRSVRRPHARVRP